MNTHIGIAILVAVLVLLTLALAVRIVRPLMSTIEELGAFLTREDNAARGGTGRAISPADGSAVPAAAR